MYFLRSLNRIIAIFVLVLAAAALHAEDGLSEAVARLSSYRFPSESLPGSSLAAADFNHDNHADGAILIRERNAFRIEVHFRGHRVRELSFPSHIPVLSISAVDVNGDGSADLVVEEPFSRQRVSVWLNDGKGIFRMAKVEDFQFESHPDTHQLVVPLQGSEPAALPGPGKMRSRFVAGIASYEGILTCVLSVSPETWTRPTGSLPAANLVRGSPKRFFLSFSV